MWTHFQNFLQFWFWDRIDAIYTFVPFVELNPMQVARIEVRCEDISTAYQIIHILYYGLILHPHNSVEIPPKIKIALFCFWLFVCLTFILTIFFLFYFNSVCWVFSCWVFRMSVSTCSSLYTNLFALCDEISGNLHLYFVQSS